MSTKYTPGPWRVDVKGCENSHGLPCVSGANGALLAMMAHNGPKGLANATLIAAAPEMYEALRGLLGAFGGDVPKWLHKEADAASAALAKAGSL